jgi:outer membrane autotransporter protein
MAYGGGFLGGVLWSATTGYAHDSISSDRVITGIGTASENHAGNEASAAAQASLPLAITGLGGPATLTPKAGLRFLYLSEDGFGETGADGFDLSNNGRSTASVQPLVGIDASEMFVAPDGTEITPEVGLAYAHEAADDGRTLTVGTVGGTSFLVQGVKPSRDMLEARAGITARARDDLFLYATYDSVLRTGNTAAQVIEAGLRLRF